jgi:hypothetical protein
MRVIAILFLFRICSSLQAQETHLGLRIGINNSIMSGPTEAAGKFASQSGFHIGPTYSYAFSDLMGIRGELLFSQKGSRYEYNGPSYFTIRKNTEFITTTGTRTMRMSINNNYIDLPIMFYTLLFEHLDLSIGGYASLLVGSGVRGNIDYVGKRDNSSATVGPIKFLLDGSYYRDKAGTIAGSVTQTIKIEGDNVTLPERIGAYYEYRSKPSGSKYNALDYGLVGAVHYRLTGGLYLGVRYQLGAADLSNDKFDIQYESLSPSKEFILNPQTYKNRSIQFAVMLQL